MRPIILLALALASCASTRTPAEAPTTLPNRAIIYETGPCFGTCPVYRLVITENGGMTFVGEKHTAVVGERRIAAPGAYERVEALLRPWRPTGAIRYAMGEPNCPNPPTDMPSVKVVWAGADAAVTGEMDFYYGCAGGNRQLADALRKVPGLLPIDDLIGKR